MKARVIKMLVAEATGTIERFESSLGETDATLLVRDDWGKRKMAYPIKKSSKGKAPHSAAAEDSETV